MRVVLAAAALSLAVATGTALAEPPEPSGATDAERCAWEWKMIPGLGVWAERCEFEAGIWTIAPDGSLPGFVLTLDGEPLGTVLQVFTRPAGTEIAAILPMLREGGHIPDDDDCVFEPAAIRPAPRTVAFFEIMPVGARLEALEATPQDEVPEPPCGEYGWGTHGVRYFMTDLRFPDRVIYVNTGQDGTMFDDRTITLE